MAVNSRVFDIVSSGHRMKQLELLPRPEVDDDENIDEEDELGMDRRVSFMP